MDISVVIGTCRPGGWDLTIPSLANQDFKGEYELVVADEIKEEREGAIKEYVKGFDLNFKHVKAENKPYASPSSTFNQAIRSIDRETELIVILGDFSVVDSDFLSKHWDAFKEFGKVDATLVASYIDLETPEIKENPKIDDISIFKEDMTVGKFLKQPVVRAEERHNFVHNWLNSYRGVLTGEFTQGLISLPRELMIRINGFSDEWDGGKGMGDRDVVERCSMLGWRFILDTSLRVYRCAHPHTKIGDLEFPFTEKDNIRTRERNRDMFKDKMSLLSRRRRLVNSHKGLRDLTWLNEKRILVQGGGAEVCTRKWVSILQHQGVPILHNESFGKFTFTNVSTIVIYGVSPWDFEWTFPYRDLCTIYFWWVGSDSWNAINGTFGMEIPKHENYRHLAISERIQDELKSIGIESEVILDYEEDAAAHLDELDEEDNYGEMAYPFTVIIYMPSDRPEFYHYDLMKEVVKEFRENDSIRFIFYGNKEPLEDFPGDIKSWPSRCYQYGYLNEEEKRRLYMETYVYLRHVEHDGFPYSLIEMKKMGRHVIVNYPYPNCLVAYTKEDIVRQINMLYEDFKEKGRPLDYHGMKYYRETFTKQNFIERFIELFYGIDCLKKWRGLE